jgi:flagellar basal body P-ring formation protein FlgA
LCYLRHGFQLNVRLRTNVIGSWHLLCFMKRAVKWMALRSEYAVSIRVLRGFFSALLITASSLACYSAHSAQSLESIQAAAEKEVRSQLPSTHGKYFVTAGRLDSRLQLADCASPLEASVPNNASTMAKATVGVRCAGPTQWTIYIPVTVEIEAPILVLRRALARRSPVEATDVELQTRRIAGNEAAFISDIGNLRGRRLKRALPAGTPLTANELVPDVLVKRGQQVTLLAASGPFEIRAQGQALADGGEHDRIRVQNMGSRKVVEGVVENASTVRVEL